MRCRHRGELQVKVEVNMEQIRPRQGEGSVLEPRFLLGEANHLDEGEMMKVLQRDWTALPKLQMNPGSTATDMI